MSNPLDELTSLLPESGRISLERTEPGNLVALVTETGEKWFLLIEKPAKEKGQPAKATLFGKISDQPNQTSFKGVSVTGPGPEADPEAPTEITATLPETDKQIKIGPIKKAAIIPTIIFLRQCGLEPDPQKPPQEQVADFLNQAFS